MILLDTNVLSALMRSEPDSAVVQWLDGQPPESIWTTSITVFEVQYGLESLAEGRRRQQLEEAFASVIEDDLENRVAAFDQRAGLDCGKLAAENRRAGRPVEIRDVQIAAIARTRKAALATRNLSHFEGIGVDLINPW